MKKVFQILLRLLIATAGLAQNLTTVTATNIQKAGVPLAVGQLCFQATDLNDDPISFQIGGGGQEVNYPFCTKIAAGKIGTFTVPNPALTAPANIAYRVTVSDSTRQVLKYTGVQFTG